MPSIVWWGTVVGIFVVVLGALRWLDHKDPEALRVKRLSGFDAIILAALMLFVGVAPTLIYHFDEGVVTANFHRLYHDVWLAKWGYGATWMGQPMVKNPLDMFVFQEVVTETVPDVIIETGTWKGGATLYFANLFDLLGTDGRVITVDITRQEIPEHPRIEYIVGSSTDPEIVRHIRKSIAPSEKVMITLDSSHATDHVLDELAAYADLVTPGNYLVVEDTHLSGHPVEFDEGDPWSAVEEFLSRDKRFERDRSRERHGMTFNPGGWLRRKVGP